MTSEVDILQVGGPFLLSVILLYRIYHDHSSFKSAANFGCDLDRLEKDIAEVKNRHDSFQASFNQTLQQFISCMSKLTMKLDLHARTLENINSNLEKITERLTDLERRSYGG